MDAREKLRNDITTRERERASKLAEKHSKMLKSTINVIQEEYPPKNPLVKMNRIQLQKLSQHGGCDYDLSCFHRSAILKVDHHKKSALQDAIIASKIVETKLEKKKADSIKRDLKKNDRYINAVNVVIKEKVLVFNYKNHDGFIKTLKELRGNDVQRRQANTIMYTKGDFGVVKRSFVDKVFNERFVGESNNNIVGSLYRNENAEASIELIAEYSPKKN